VTTTGELSRSVHRAAEAGLPVSVVELHAPGEVFTPPRGRPGARYPGSGIAVRTLSDWGNAAPAGDVMLYPAPEARIERVILLPLEDRNWLPHDDDLERSVVEQVQLVAAARQAS
jgi:hypothetical protein